MLEIGCSSTYQDPLPVFFWQEFHRRVFLRKTGRRGRRKKLSFNQRDNEMNEFGDFKMLQAQYIHVHVRFCLIWIRGVALCEITSINTSCVKVASEQRLPHVQAAQLIHFKEVLTTRPHTAGLWSRREALASEAWTQSHQQVALWCTHLPHLNPRHRRWHEWLTSRCTI